MSSDILKLDYCSYQAAKYAVMHWHYSKRMPGGPQVFIGVWERSVFIGCVCFGLGAGSSADGRKYGLRRNHDMAELTRVALNKHETPVSKILSIAIRMFKKTSKGIRLIVSFADKGNMDHMGIIYQASNWIYTGYIDSSNAILLFGKEIHKRTVSSRGWNYTYIKNNVDKDARFCRSLKFRYLYPLDDKIRETVVKYSKPYPKRAGSVIGSTGSYHDSRGGSIPTPALLHASK